MEVPDDEGMEELNLEDEEVADPESEEELEQERKPTKKAKHSVARKKWSKTEMDELNKYFKSYLAAGVTPRGPDCEKAKLSSKNANGEIHKRQNHLIIKKISALNHKKK